MFWFSLLAMRALNIAATGMAAQEENISVISNNVANINTTAFKKGRASFNDLFYQNIELAADKKSKVSDGIQIGAGVRVNGVHKDFTQGAVKITNNPFDLMIRGDGFFAVIDANGELRYTRDGSFRADKNGEIVTSDGYRLYPGFVIPLGVRSINISKEGRIDLYMPESTEADELGTIPIFTFINNGGLRALGQNLFAATAASGTPAENIAGTNNAGTIMQGSLEISNVNMMTEMTDLIRAQRSYEMNSKVMQVADQMMQVTNGVIR